MLRAGGGGEGGEEDGREATVQHAWQTWFLVAGFCPQTPHNSGQAAYERRYEAVLDVGEG